MNILIVSQYFWPEDFPITDLALGLSDAGHDVSVLTGVPNYPKGVAFQGYSPWRPSEESYSGLSIRRVPIITRGNSKGSRLVLNYLSFVLSGCSLGTLKIPKDIEVILVYEPSPITVTIPALLIGRLRKVPTFLWVQDLWPETLTAVGAVKAPLVLKIISKMVGYIYHACDRILVQSKAFIPPILGYGISPDKVVYFPNTVESLYRPLERVSLYPEADLLPEGFKVMFAGNIGAAQDFETLLATAERLREEPEIKLIIIGDGRLYPWVKAEVERRGLAGTVYLLGRYPRESMPRFFCYADALLVSLKKHPIFSCTIPSKVQAYLACGRPVIASLDGEGGRIIRESGAGIAVEAENPDKLTEAILKLYKLAPDERESMGYNARKYFKENFEREMLLDKLSKLFESTR